MKQNTDIIRGDVYIVKTEDTLSPYLVVQNNSGNKFAPTTIAVPIVVQNETHESLVKVSAASFRHLAVEKFTSGAIVWEPRTIDKVRIRSYVGTLSSQTMWEVNRLGEDNLILDESEVRWVNLPDAIGSEQGGTRPCLITKNKNGSTIAIPVTNAIHMKKTIPTHMILDKKDFVDVNRSLEHMSILLWEQQRHIREQDVMAPIGRLNDVAKEKAVGPAKISVGLARVMHA